MEKAHLLIVQTSADGNRNMRHKELRIKASLESLIPGHNATEQVAQAQQKLLGLKGSLMIRIPLVLFLREGTAYLVKHTAVLITSCFWFCNLEQSSQTM